MKKQTKKKLIYIRYILPPILIVLTLLVMLIPSYRYVINGEVEQPTSALALMSSSYEQTRSVLFGTAEQSNANLVFSRILLTLIILSSVLFALSLAVSVYCAAVALIYFTADDEERAERIRTLFITLIPNRVIACIGQALCLGFVLIPYICPWLYKYAYGSRVVLTLTAPDGLMFCGLAIIAIIALSMICAPMEREFGADIFKKNKLSVTAKPAQESEEYTPVFSTDGGEADRERNERIRELLGKNKEN